MTLSATELALYAGALVILFMTPGPVWVALIARSLSGGFRGAWPLAVGVVVGDVIWPLLAIFGVSALVTVYEDILLVLRLAGALMFIVMGALLIWHRAKRIGENSALTAPGAWAGFTAGVLVIMGNPKAILFYMGILPNFFDLSRVTTPDILVICALSAAVPLAGNLVLGLFIGRIRALLSSQEARAKLNLTAGILMILVGLAIAIL